MSDNATTIAKAKAVLTTAEALSGATVVAALDIIELAGALAKEQDVDIRTILTGDTITDRALLEAADVQAAIGRTFDWSAVPDVAFRVAGTVLSLAAAFA